MGRKTKFRLSWAALGVCLLGIACSTAPCPSLSARWDPILEILNQDPTRIRKDPSTHSLNEDLLKVYESELKGIERDLGPAKKETPAARIERTDRFYHEKISALNRETLGTLVKAAQAPSPNHQKEARAVLKQVGENAVAKLESVPSYDPSGQIGFCFGRALLIHYLLLKKGVSQDDLARIFMVGQLQMNGQFWNFHTAILARDAKDGFIVIDPLQEKILPYREWIAVNNRYDVKGSYSRARFYVTDPRKFLPAFGVYHRDQLENPILKPYFDGLADHLKRMNVSTKRSGWLRWWRVLNVFPPYSFT